MEKKKTKKENEKIFNAKFIVGIILKAMIISLIIIILITECNTVLISALETIKNANVPILPVFIELTLYFIIIIGIIDTGIKLIKRSSKKEK